MKTILKLTEIQLEITRNLNLVLSSNRQFANGRLVKNLARVSVLNAKLTEELIKKEIRNNFLKKILSLFMRLVHWFRA